MSEKPEKSDVIVWLQGDRFDRGEKVLELFRNKFAPIILISGNNIRMGQQGEKEAFFDANLDEIKNYLINNGIKQQKILIDDKSLNTGMHPKNIMMFAKKNNWKKIILVSSPYHQLRVFLTFVKYFNENNENIKIINQSVTDLPWDGLAGGKTKTRADIFFEELIKIKKYKQDVATYDQGLEYINDNK
ncbi:MAG: YdcF family protein [Candidatus Magasanikbacteria bacterium]